MMDFQLLNQKMCRGTRRDATGSLLGNLAESFLRGPFPIFDRPFQVCIVDLPSSTAPTFR